MVTINFGNFPKVTVQDGLAPIPKGRMEVTNPLPKKQETESHSVDDQILWNYVGTPGYCQWQTMKI